MATCENVLLKRTNGEKYIIAIIAKFEEPLPVRYIIRVTAPNGRKADYVCGLNCFRIISELLSALQYFAETELYHEDTAKLKTVLTAANFKSFVEILKSTKV